MNVRHVKLPWILRLSVTELGRACSEEEHSRIQCTVGKTGYLKQQQQKNNNTQNENKTPLGLLTQRSSSLTTCRDASSPQKPVPSAFPYPQHLLLFLPPLECAGSESCTPTHSQKPQKRAIFPPLFPLPVPALFLTPLLPHPTPVLASG